MLEKALFEVGGAFGVLDARLKEFRQLLLRGEGDLRIARKNLEEAVKGLEFCLNGLKVAFEKFKTKAGAKISTDDDTKEKVRLVELVIGLADDLIKAAKPFVFEPW